MSIYIEHLKLKTKVVRKVVEVIGQKAEMVVLEEEVV
jgi:hypothetical protein